MSAPPRGVAVGAVNIARLTETVSMLPFALYHACTLEGRMMDGYERHDGTVEHLSAEDLRLCVGANTLAKEMSFFVKSVFKRTPSAACKAAKLRKVALVDICDDVELNALGECDVLDSYKEALEMGVVDFKLCKICKTAMLDRQVAERRKVWKMSPDVCVPDDGGGVWVHQDRTLYTDTTVSLDRSRPAASNTLHIVKLAYPLPHLRQAPLRVATENTAASSRK